VVDPYTIVLLHLTSTHTLFLSNAPTTTHIYTLSLHDALPISQPAALPLLWVRSRCRAKVPVALPAPKVPVCRPLRLVHLLPMARSEEHTSELQSLRHLVCRLLLEKKKINNLKSSHTAKMILTS